jgi:hypothetical protein
MPVSSFPLLVLPTKTTWIAENLFNQVCFFVKSGELSRGCYCERFVRFHSHAKDQSACHNGGENKDQSKPDQ